MASIRTRPRAMRIGVGAGILLLLVLVGIVVAHQRQDPSVPPDAAPSYEAGRVLATDTFTRTVGAGWGTADVGGPWDVTVPADFSVEGGVGVIDLPRPGAARVATLGSVRSSDLMATVDMVAPKPTTRGSGVYVGLQLRTNGRYFYRVVLRFSPDQRVFGSIARYDGNEDQRVQLLPEHTVAKGVKEGQRLNVAVSVTGSDPVQISTVVRTGSARPVPLAATDTSASRLVAGGPLSVWTYVAGTSDANKRVGLDNLNVHQLSASAPSVTPDANATDGTGSMGEPGTAPTPTPVPSSAPEDPLPGARGAPPLGSTHYTVPVDALFVSPTGTGTASGALADPFDTIQGAVDAAPDGATVVVRGGSYHESVLLPVNKVVHLQSYPGEKVWLEGTSVVRGWQQKGIRWEVPWTHHFDSSPTYTKGAKDGKEEGWRFVSPSHPLAAHPDQVWVDGRRLTQVSSRSRVTADSFYVDEHGDRLVVGTDPSQAEVRASTLSKALTVVGIGDSVRGIGVRRYATSVWELGAATVNNSGVTMEDMVFADNATTGLSVFAADVTLARLTSSGNGLMGFHANQADRLQATGLSALDNNREHFNRTPAAGGMKLTSSRDVRITDSEFSDNEGHGLWFDVACYDVDLAGNRAERNTGSGIVLEISSHVRVVDNLALDNGLNGLWVIDTDSVEVANNTLARNEGANLVLVTDGRTLKHPGLSTGDPRRPDDPEMVWQARAIQVYDNVLADGGGCVVCVVDYTGRLTGPELDLQIDHNYYQQPAAGVPFASWPSGNKARSLTYADVAAFRDATGQDRASVVAPAGPDPAVARSGALSAAVNEAAPEVAQGLSGTAAAASDGEVGMQQLGAWSVG